MLNVKVLTGANVEAYYAEAVVSGVEDYYLGTDAPAGVWCASASLLGLSGDVDRADLTAVLDDRHPQDGVRLGVADNRRVRGFDLTFRAPKSVSVAWAFAPPDVAAKIVAGHTAAVAAAVGFLEREACAVRRGHNGLATAAGGGFVAAAFVHRTSRERDPLLHTHVIVANSTPTRMTGCGGRSTADGSSPTPRPPATSTKPTSATSSPAASVPSGVPSVTVSANSPASTSRCGDCSRNVARRSSRNSPVKAAALRVRHKSRRSRHGRRRSSVNTTPTYARAGPKKRSQLVSPPLT